VQRADPPTHKRCRQRGHAAQPTTGGYLQTALLELWVFCVDIELIAVGCASNLGADESQRYLSGKLSARGA
jgi:hypothetical protein